MIKQQKVLFIATVASHIKAFHEPFLKLFKDRNYKVYVAAKNNLSNGDIINYCDTFVEIPIERSPFSFSNFNAINQLKKIITDEKIDVVHCHTPMGAVVGRLASKTARKKINTRVIYTAHGFHFFKGASLKNWLLFYPVEWFLSKYTDTMITINQEDYCLAREKFSKRCGDINYVPGVGVDSKKFDFVLSNSEKNKYRKDIGIKENDFVLIFPARLDKNKNQSFLIEVMKILVKRHNNIHLLLPGRDELNGYYQEIVKQENLEDNIHFLGFRKDIPELLKISDVAVSSSLREGLSVNIIESIICNIPVVVLNCRGMSELIDNGKNGFLIELNDESKVDNFVDCILEYYNGKKYIKKEKKLEITIEEVTNLMNSIYFNNK